MPFDTFEDFIENGSAPVGSPDQIVEKLLTLQRSFGNEVFGVGFEGFFFASPETTRDHLERFFAEVVPVVRAAAPSRPWQPVQETPTEEQL